MSDYRVIVTGSRKWRDASAIERAIDEVIAEHGNGMVLVHGACPYGADHITATLARDKGITTEAHPALWNEHGKRAGFVRNAEMVKRGAVVCLAFVEGLSRGTLMTANLALKAGIPVKMFTPAEPSKEES